MLICDQTPQPMHLVLVSWTPYFIEYLCTNFLTTLKLIPGYTGLQGPELPPEETKVGVNGKSQVKRFQVQYLLQEERMQLMLSVTLTLQSACLREHTLVLKHQQLATLTNPREVNKDLLETNPILLAGAFWQYKTLLICRNNYKLLFFSSIPRRQTLTV